MCVNAQRIHLIAKTLSGLFVIQARVLICIVRNIVCHCLQYCTNDINAKQYCCLLLFILFVFFVIVYNIVQTILITNSIVINCYLQYLYGCCCLQYCANNINKTNVVAYCCQYWLYCFALWLLLLEMNKTICLRDSGKTLESMHRLANQVLDPDGNVKRGKKKHVFISPRPPRGAQQ